LVSTVYLFFGEKWKKYCDTAFIVVLLILGVMTYQRNKVWESDYALWKDSLEKTPENPRAMINYGFALVKQDQYNTGIRYYTKAINKDSTIVNAYFNRAIAQFDLGRYSKAVSDMSRVIDERKDSEVPYFFRGTSYAHMKKLPEALADLSRSIELNPTMAETYKNRGIVYEYAEEYELALADFSHVLKLDPSNIKMLINRSKIYYLLDDYPKALEDILYAERAGLQVDQNYIRMLQIRIANPSDSIAANRVIRID
ncbi:MAG: tetratricopeptide repeat protein, partial [Bacteroidota bacterium]|nr:tetratricopeptide repeat protein [Bacteroidota bacterium]